MKTRIFHICPVPFCNRVAVAGVHWSKVSDAYIETLLKHEFGVKIIETMCPTHKAIIDKIRETEKGLKT